MIKDNRDAGDRRIKLSRPLAILDLETTGTSQEVDRIVAIGIVRIRPKGEKHTSAKFHALINPGIPIPKEASKIHKISDRDVADAPSFRKIAKQLAKFLEECDPAGFNVSGFDLPLLRKEFQRAGIHFKTEGRHVIDAQRIFHIKEPRDLSAAVKFYCGIEHKKAHTAIDDARACWKVLKAQIKRYPDLPITTSRLADFCSQLDERFVDEGGWFERRHGKPAFARGKHRGRVLSEVARKDRGYLEWMLGLDDLPKDTQGLVRRALERTK